MKKNLLKTMLVGVMALTATSVSAQTTTLLEYGTADAPWTAETLAQWTAGGNPTITDGYVGISGGNGSYATSITTAPTENAIINIQAVWRGRSNTGRAFSAGNGSYFRFGNIVVAQNDQDKKHGYTFNGLSDLKNVSTFAVGSYRVDISQSTWLLIEMEINTASNTVNSFSIKSEDGATTYASASDIVLSNADYTTVAFGYHKSGSVSTANAEQLKFVKVTQTVQAVETASYTVKYVCNGEEVKEAATRTGVVGQNITLTEGDIQNFYSADGTKKYIYVSNDAEGKTVTEGAVVTVTFREAEIYAWTAKSSVGTYTVSGQTFEGDKASVKYPLYVLVEGKLWTKAAIDKVFAQNFDVTENNQELTLEYTETEIADVVFLAEVEDIEGMGIVDNGNAAARSSQRAAGYSVSDNTLITTLPLGKYKMTASFYSPTSAGGNYKFYTGPREIWAITTGNANATDGNTEIVLAKETNQILLGQTGATAAVDYIFIQSLGTPTEEELAAATQADEDAAVAAALAAAKANLSTVIEAAKAIDTTDALAEAVTALNEAISAAETAMNAADATKETVEAATNALKVAMATFFANKTAFPADAVVYNFAAAAAAGENPGNKNGSAANGQAFYGWEKSDKIDSKRQDYKGYEWAEGSVLPQVCHVWRRSDRINGNVKLDNAGLYCPSDKEMAVDGLQAGDKVIIVYDATNAADGNKELVWAIGVTADGPRATAIIGGVEAVSGETTIASGAEIEVQSAAATELANDVTGYIVFQVKKGMTIYQIAVVPGSLTTGIEAVSTATVNDTVIYDLQGRRVQNAQSGLYIVNGRKVVIK